MKNNKLYALFAAIIFGVVGLFLLTRISDDTVNKETSNKVPLFFESIKNGQKADVEKLLASNQKLVNSKNEEDETALEYALKYQQYDISSLLLVNGGKVSADSDSPLFVYMAFSLNSYQGQDSSKEEEIKEKKNLFKMGLKHQKQELIKTNELGNNVLHITALKGDIDVLQLLLAEGVDPSVKNKNGETAMYIAVQVGHLSVVKQLSDTGEKLLEHKNTEGETLIAVAAMNGRHDILQYLLTEVPELIDEQNQFSKTALMYAAEYGDEQSVDYLLEAGADKELKSAENLTAYDYAVKWNHSVIVDRLK